MNTVQLIRYGSIPGQGTYSQIRTNGWTRVALELDKYVIPYGQWTCSLYDSPTHGWVYMLQDVPGHDYLEIHIANVMQELKGCIALGKEFACLATPATNGKMMLGVTHSQAAFEEFMHLMNGEDFLLSIERDI